MVEILFVMLSFLFRIHFGTGHEKGVTFSNESNLPYIIFTLKYWDSLTLVILKKLRCYAHFKLSASQITWSRLLIQIHILNDKQCRSRSVGFFRSQLIWIYAVCKGKVYPVSAGLGWSPYHTWSKIWISLFDCLLIFLSFMEIDHEMCSTVSSFSADSRRAIVGFWHKNVNKY